MFYSLEESYLTSIYNTRIQCYKNKNILLIHKEQNTTGSVDEKFPYIIESMLHDTSSTKIIVLQGTGYRKRALDWIENKADQYNFYIFYSVDEANRFLKGIV